MKADSSGFTESNTFIEKSVISVTTGYLEKNNFDIIYLGENQGPDIVAYKPSTKELLIIEVKGVPSAIKIKGENKGKAKKQSTIEHQFWGWSGSVIIQLMEREYEWNNRSASWVMEVMKKLGHMTPSKIRYVAILGYHEKYVEKLEKRKHAILRLGYEVLLIDKHANVRYKIP